MSNKEHKYSFQAESSNSDKDFDLNSTFVQKVKTKFNRSECSG